MRAGKTPDEFIREYHATIKHLYPELTEKQIIDICKSPFKLVATEMKKGTMKDIRIKYLGCFTIFPGRVKGLLKKVTDLYENGKVNIEYLTEVQTLAQTYSNNQKQKNGNNSLEESVNR
jgi:F420-0:gamma-glutamyl ligase-like protein